MNKNKPSVFLFVLTFIVMSLFVSCNDNVLSDKGYLEIIENPIIEEVEEVEGIRVISVTKAKYLLYKMVPLWNTTNGVAAYGSTVGMGIPTKEDGTLLPDKYKDYKLISSDSSNLGYFSQGKRASEVDVLDEEYNSLLSSVISREIYLNTVSSTIEIDLDREMFESKEDFVLSIKNMTLNLVYSSDYYGQEVKNGYRILATVTKLPSTTDKGGVVVENFMIPASAFSFVDADKTNTGSLVTGIINYTFGNNFSSGSYSITLRLQEHNGSNFVEAGGITFSFIGVGGTNTKLFGSGSAIDIYPADYVTPGGGTGGVIIDSGINSVITITSKVGVNAVENNTVTNGTTVTFTASVTQNGVPISDISNNIWMVNGDIQSGFDTNVFSYQFTENKTYTITYMFTDSTSYNTISKNEYIKVTAASSTN